MASPIIDDILPLPDFDYGSPICSGTGGDWEAS
jgi:hypothetical protein